jgi:hypothetical protein
MQLLWYQKYMVTLGWCLILQERIQFHCLQKQNDETKNWWRDKNEVFFKTLLMRQLFNKKFSFKVFQISFLVPLVWYFYFILFRNLIFFTSQFLNLKEKRESYWKIASKWESCWLSTLRQLKRLILMFISFIWWEEFYLGICNP